MDDDTRAALTEALVREAVGLVVVLGLVWALGPGKTWLSGVAHRVQTRRKHDPHEGIVRQFGAEVSRWDHEQATQQDRPAAGGSPCGCG